MKCNLIKRLAPGATFLIAVLAASAQIPVGPAPPIVPIPAGLNPISGPTYGFPGGGYHIPVAVGQELFASGGPVYVTDLGPTGAGYDEDLFVASPATPYGIFMNDHSTLNGTTYSLGTFAPGTEIEFGLDVTSTGSVWYDGPGSRNSDGDVHAYMVNDYQGLPNTTYVGFEDEDGSFADFNYLDEIYAFTGVAAVTTAPDASSTMCLLGMGVTTLAWFGRRLRK